MSFSGTIVTKYRSVVWEEDFRDEAWRLFGDAQRADELLTGVTIVLSRNPFGADGVTQVSTTVFAMKMHPMPTTSGRRHVTILFTVDDHNVYWRELL